MGASHTLQVTTKNIRNLVCCTFKNSFTRFYSIVGLFKSDYLPIRRMQDAINTIAMHFLGISFCETKNEAKQGALNFDIAGCRY